MDLISRMLQKWKTAEGGGGVGCPKIIFLSWSMHFFGQLTSSSQVAKKATCLQTNTVNTDELDWLSCESADWRTDRWADTTKHIIFLLFKATWSITITNQYQKERSVKLWDALARGGRRSRIALSSLTTKQSKLCRIKSQRNFPRNREYFRPLWNMAISWVLRLDYSGHRF